MKSLKKLFFLKNSERYYVRYLFMHDSKAHDEREKEHPSYSGETFNNISIHDNPTSIFAKKKCIYIYIYYIFQREKK